MSSDHTELSPAPTTENVVDLGLQAESPWWCWPRPRCSRSSRSTEVASDVRPTCQAVRTRAFKKRDSVALRNQDRTTLTRGRHTRSSRVVEPGSRISGSYPPSVISLPDTGSCAFLQRSPNPAAVTALHRS